MNSSPPSTLANFQEAHLRAIVESSPECVKVVSPDGTLLHMNPAGLAMIEAESASAVIGKSIYDVIAPEHRQAFRAFNERICRGESGTLEFDIIGIRGTRRHMETNAVPLPSDNGSVNQLGLTRDITSRKSAESAILQLTAQSEKERRLYDAILSSTPDFVYVFDLNHRFTYANASLLKTWGKTFEEAIGKNCLELGYEPWHAAMHDREIRQVVATKQPVRGEVPFTGEGLGERRIYDYIFVPVLGANGEVEAVAGTTRDVTQRKTAEEAASLRAAIVESSNDAIITKNLEGVITSWNPSAQRIFGYMADEIIGKPVTTLFPTNLVKEEASIIQRIKSGERIDHYETMRKRKDGRLFPVSLTVSPVRDASGKIIGASKIVRDITAQKDYETRLIDQANELEQFAYVASHDLQEPLRKLGVYTELLLSRVTDAAGPEATKYAGYISDAVKRMQKLITELLNYSRTGRTDQNLLPVYLGDVVKSVQADLEVLIRENKATITAQSLPQVVANPYQMHQLFQNLLSNAIKFKKQIEEPRIEITGQETSDSVVISVKDNGIGMAQRYHDRVFRVFQRLHSGSTYPGTGIGLAICKKIVELHQGRIWFESEEGVGTTFHFSLPKTQPETTP